MKTTTATAEEPQTSQAPSLILVSEWLSELNSHCIYDSAGLKADFAARTGYAAPDWPEYSGERINAAIRSRGLGGTLVDETKDVMSASGWQIAETLARHFANWQGTYQQGRGSRFRACVAALKEAGQ